MDEHLFKDSTVSSDRILYTPSAFARQSLLHLQEAGVLRANQPHSSNREHLSSWLFFIVLAGSGTLIYSDTVYELHANDCVFIDCRNPYIHETDRDLWSLRWIHFNGPQIPDIYRKYAERGGSPVFTPDDPRAYADLLEDVHALAASTDYIKDMRINEKITSLLTLCMNETVSPVYASQPKADRMNRIKAYIDDHYAEKITLELLSQTFFINRFYLARLFRDCYGITVNNYLTEVRLRHAKELLRFTDLPLEEIGVLCGMKSGAYLSRAFKKAEGIPPLSYRRQW